MSSEPSPPLPALKQQLRKAAQLRRAKLTDRPERSARITERLLKLPEFQSAKTVLFYVSVRSEVDTRPALQAALVEGKTIAVPYCSENSLHLVRIESLADLQTGAYQIPEPAPDLCVRPDRQLQPTEIEFVVVPGVAFDRRGNRLGHGAGYYDRLLAQMSSPPTLAALAFDCQLTEAVPAESHDVRMHYVLTETECIRTGIVHPEREQSCSADSRSAQ